jgi:glycine/D-amino acid oxidase-like deaminating enzyme
LWDLQPDKLETFAAEHASWGYDIRRVNRSQISEIEPNLKSPPEVALHIAEEGKVEPLETARLLVQGAVELGAALVINTRVKWLIEDRGKVTGVAVSDGVLHADEVVVAVGSETAALMETIGIGVAMERPAGLLVHSAPLDELLNGLVMAPEFHVKQDKAGRLVAGSDFGGGFDVNDAEGEARRLHDKIRSAISGAESVKLAFHTVTERPTPADGLPAIGRIGGREGLYLVVTHSGITLASAIGRFVAEELLQGRRDSLLMPFDPNRLAKEL